jgi:hypothetical protein
MRDLSETLKSVWTSLWYTAQTRCAPNQQRETGRLQKRQSASIALMNSAANAKLNGKSTKGENVQMSTILARMMTPFFQTIQIVQAAS